MSTRIKNMTEGRPAGLIFAFALPLMLGNVFQQLYTVVDTMVVGKYLGVSALAALGASDWLTWMMLGIVQGFAQGFAILMSHEFGAGQYARLRRVVGNSAMLAAAFSLVLVGRDSWPPGPSSCSSKPPETSSPTPCSICGSSSPAPPSSCSTTCWPAFCAPWGMGRLPFRPWRWPPSPTSCWT